jgi:stage II sporulation protein D
MIHVRTAVEGQKQIVALPLEEYVLASVLSELAPSTGDAAALRRAFEVQAIVARTYAVANRGRHRAERFDLCDTTHCQLVDLERPRRSRWANLARAAIDATRGAVIYDGIRPATVLFHADCGGHRASATDVWGGAAGSYLRGGPDPLPDGSRHLTWHYAIEREKLRAALNSTERTSVGGRLDTIEVQSRDASGRARLLLLNGERAPLVRGEDFRGAMNAALGASAIRSARFDVRRDGNTFVFDGEGFGHGVGLCQRGALAHASAGSSVANIIEFYFPGTTVRTTVQHVRNLMPSLRAVACRAPHGPAHQRTRAASAHQG